jgi:hypothetical protein
MIAKGMSFYSGGYKLRAKLFLPDDYKEGEKRPCIIANSGYMGLLEIYPSLFARALTKKGYIAFGFNYRGFSDNEGPAGVCKLNEQVDDIKNAVTFVQTLDAVNPDKIWLLGWGMGAALVAKATAEDDRVKAMAGLNGFYNGERWLRAINTYADFIKIKNEIMAEKVRLVKEGTRKFADPFYFYPLDPATNDVVRADLYKQKDYGQEISLEIGQSILEFNAEKYVDNIKVPVFIGHGERNLLHPVDESILFYNKISSKKELYIIDGQHNDFMFDDHPVLNSLVTKLDSFFSQM